MIFIKDHPNIMKVFELYEDEHRFYIVTEYLEGGELFDHLIEHKCFDEKTACNIMKQIFAAISYCHQKKIVHRGFVYYKF